jgi:hypothetical protein
MSDIPLVDACRSFALFKDQLDESLTEIDDPFKFPFQRRAITPRIFLHDTLPFSDSCDSYGTTAPDIIDPTLVISGQYKNYAGQGKSYDQATMDWSDKIVSDNFKYNSQAPTYTRVGTMPLYVALEGKNRVTLFKRHRRLIRAFITPVAYPDPSDLTIVRIPPFGVYGLAYRDSNIKVMPYPEITLPLLRAYGVTRQEKVWSLRASLIVRKMKKNIRSSLMIP